MGIPRFRGWLWQNFPLAFKAASKNPKKMEFDHVYFDLNMIFHMLRRRSVKNRHHYAKMIFTSLRVYLESVTIPRRTVYLAVDGSSPLAKIWTQRCRRELELIKARNGGKSSADVGDSPIRSIELTPGTELMQRMKHYLRYFACQYLMHSNRRQLQVIVSAADVPGEGEHKIMDHRNAVALSQLKRKQRTAAQCLHQTDQAAPEDEQKGADSTPSTSKTTTSKNSSNSAIIVGGDADLFLMMLASGVPNTYYLLLGPGKNVYTALFSVNSMLKELSKATGVPLEDPRMHRVRYDFVLLGLLLGNDYVPKLRGVSMDALWQFYKEMHSTSSLPDESRFIYNDQKKSIRLDVLHDLLQKVWDALPTKEMDLTEPWEDNIKSAPFQAEQEDPFKEELQTGSEGEDGIERLDLDAASQDESETDDEKIVFTPADDRPLQPPELTTVAEDGLHLLSERIVKERLVLKPNPSLYAKGLLWCLDLYAGGRHPLFNFEYAPRRALTIKEFTDWIQDHMKEQGPELSFANERESVKPLTGAYFPVSIIPHVKAFSPFIPDELRPLCSQFVEESYDQMRKLHDKPSSDPVFYQSVNNLERAAHGLGKVYSNDEKNEQEHGSNVVYYRSAIEGKKFVLPNLSQESDQKHSFADLTRKKNGLMLGAHYYPWYDVPGGYQRPSRATHLILKYAEDDFDV